MNAPLVPVCSLPAVHDENPRRAVMSGPERCAGTGVFILVDRGNVLEPEDHLTFHQALVRANDPLWAGRPWVIVDPTGRYAATPSRRT